MTSATSPREESMSKLAGKVAIGTGASKGIGYGPISVVFSVSLVPKESSQPEMIMAILSIVSFSSIGSLGQAMFPHLRNPFADVGWAVSKFDSAGLRDRKRPDCFKAHHRDLCKI